jgi:LysM repeat protein
VATVAVWLATAAAKPATAAHPKMVIKSGRLVLPIRITSPKVAHSNIEPDWQQIPRLGDQPLQRKGNPRMRQMRVDIILTVDNGHIENQLSTLYLIANNSTPCTLGNMGSLEQGFWWITAMPITSETREFGTNRITRATVALTFTMAALNSYQLPTATSAKPIKPTPTGSTTHAPTPTRPKTYTVKSGDTLTAIAARFYGDPDKYAAIAAANKIRNPNLIYPGQRLTLP